MKKLLRSLFTFLLAIVMMVPTDVFAATTITQSTKNNVDKIISYADQLRNTSNPSSTTGGFVWDTEKKSYSWAYYNGLMMDALMDVGGTANFNFVDNFYNANINSDGSIVNVSAGKVSTGALDSCEPLRPLFDLIRTSSRKDKYKKAIQKWYNYLENQITYSNCGGNYAHKQDNTTTVTSSWREYPVALDGLYMAQPFLMETANAIDAGLITIKNKNGSTVSSASIYNAVYNRLVWIYNNLYNPSTGLYDHGYNPSTRKTNGVTWSRSLGWYVMALVDVIEMMPEGSMKNDLIGELPRIFDGLLRYQDASGLWYNVTAYNSSLWGTNQNILETSGSSMFAYAMVKAAQNGYVTDAKYYNAAIKAFNGVVNTKLRGSQGNYSVVDTYRSSGASTTPSYYCNNSYTTNEAKGVGSLIMLAALLKNNATVGSSDEVVPDVPMQTVTTTAYELATTIDTNSEYLMASGNNGNVKILGHTGYNVYNTDATVSNNVLTSSFSHANGNDVNYLWKFSQANTSVNQTSSPVISNATALGSNEPVSYIQNWDRNQIGAWGGGITVVNKGGYFTMKQRSNYIDAGNTQNATSAKNIYLFKKVVTTTQVPAVHEHDYQLISEKAGTCTTKGQKTYKCSICQEEKTVETVLGDHSFKFVNETTGTCSAKGQKIYKCEYCQQIKAEDTTYGTHNFVFDHETTGNCSVKGQKIYKCTVCQEEKAEDTAYGAHNFIFDHETTGTCSAKGQKIYKCEYCQQTKAEDTVYGEHNFVFDHETTGNCSVKGQKIYKCEYCDETKAEDTVYGAHSFVFDHETTGNCSVKGQKIYKCEYCDETKAEDTVYGDHGFKLVNETTGDCCTKGQKIYKCEYCDETKVEDTVYGGHSFKLVNETTGTCSVKGQRIYKCTICQEEKTEDTAYGAHNFVFDHETTGNCSVKGQKIYKCAICQKEKAEDTAYGDHNFIFDHETTGTCSVKGQKIYKCEYCRHTKAEDTVYGDHSFVFDHETTGNCSVKGQKIYKCEYCDETKTEDTVYGDHGFKLVNETTGDCCTKGQKIYKCEYCDETKVEDTVYGGHSFKLVNETTGTCSAKGQRIYKCTICQEEKTEDTAYGAHNFIFDHETTGNCSVKGQKIYKCEYCDETKAEDTVYGDHSFVFDHETTGNCSEKGQKIYKCEYCDETKAEDTVYGDHSFVFDHETTGDCCTKGQKIYKCEYCDETQVESTTYGDHAFELVNETTGNCSVKGQKIYKCTICQEEKAEDTVYGDHSFVFNHETTGNCSVKGQKIYKCEYCQEEKAEDTAYGDHNFIFDHETTGNCSVKGQKIYKCEYCQQTKAEDTVYGDHSFVLDHETTGNCSVKGQKIYKCTICQEEKAEDTVYGDHSYRLVEDVPAANGNDGYKKYRCDYCGDSYQETVEPEFEIVEETVTTVTYQLATSITAGEKYIIASGNNGNVTIIGNNNGTAFKSTAYVTNGKIDMSGKNLNQFMWNFASATTGKISNNGLYVKTSSASQFNTTGEQMAIRNYGNGAYQIYKTTSAGVTSYLNPNNLTSKTLSAKNVYLFKEVKTTVVNRYEVHIEYVNTTATVYERATTIDTNSEYLMASGNNGNVKILGHTGYNVYNTAATVSNNVLTSSFSHANGNDANYLWKFSKANTSVNQTSSPVISNATALGSNEPVSYIQNWDRNQIGAWGGGITVVNKGGYFTMKQGNNYIDAGNTQNATSAKNIYLFKKTTKVVTTENRVLVKIN